MPKGSIACSRGQQTSPINLKGGRVSYPLARVDRKPYTYETITTLTPQTVQKSSEKGDPTRPRTGERQEK